MKNKLSKLEKSLKKIQDSFARNAYKDWQDFDLKLKNDPVLSKGPPYLTHLLRYRNAVGRMESHGELLEKKIKLSDELDALEMKAREGYIAGLCELAFLAVEATKRLNNWAEKDPKYVADVAETMPLWPTLVTHNSARDPSLKALLQDIRLDAAVPLGVPSAKVGTEPVESKEWALSLLQAIQEARSVQGITELKFSRWGYRQDHWESMELIFGLPNREEILIEAKLLEPLEVATTNAWWKLGKKVLRLNFEQKPEFLEKLIAVYGQTDKIRNAVSKGNSTVGLKKDRAVEEVRKMFFRLAKEVSP